MTWGLPNNASALCQGQDFITYEPRADSTVRRQRGSRREQGGSTLDVGPRSAKHLAARRRDASSPRAVWAVGGEWRVDFTELGPSRLSQSRAGPIVTFSISPLHLLWGDAPPGTGCPKMLQERPHCEMAAQGTYKNQDTESTTEIVTIQRKYVPAFIVQETSR